MMLSCDRKLVQRRHAYVSCSASDGALHKISVLLLLLSRHFEPQHTAREAAATSKGKLLRVEISATHVQAWKICC
jgi:hypothetical protein